MVVQLSRVAAHVEEFTNRYPSLKSAAPWGLAVSGGADSTALVCAVRELGREAVVLHVNYGLRGAESDADEDFVRKLSARWGMRCEVLAARPAGESEEELREIRYRWFRGLGLGAILTAHTRDDQAETVLYRILRGTGPDGLAGIQACLEGEIYRPLLEVSREEVRAYLRESGEAWREDSSNRNLSYRRNWIRHVLLPQVEERINPEVAAALARLGEVAADEQEWWEQWWEERLRDFAAPEGKAWVLDLVAFRAAAPALQRRLLRSVFARLGGGEGIGFEHVEAARALCAQEEGSGRMQAPGLDLMRSFDWLRVARQGEAAAGERNFRYPLEAPGRVEPAEGGGVVLTTLAEISQYNESGQNLDWSRLEEARRAGQRLELRNWRPGDEYQRVGRERPEKLKELFQKYRIPLWQRRNWPIVVLGDEPVWVRQFGVSSAFAANPQSKRVLRVEWFAAAPPGAGS